MKVYSPTTTENYMRCPRLWALQAEGWRSARIDYPDVSMAIGTGVHHVAHLFHQHVIDVGTVPDEANSHLMVQGGVEAGTASLFARERAGAQPNSRIDDWEDSVVSGVRRGGLAYMSAFPGLSLADYEIVSAEHAFGAPTRADEGYEGTADLIVRDDYGLAVVDIKTKQAFKQEYYRNSFIQQFAHSWQLYQYSWLAARDFGETPKRFYLVMIEMTPKPKVEVHPYRLDPDFLAIWLHTVSAKWAEMEAIENGEAVPGIANEHFFFGKLCPFYHACFTHGLSDAGLQAELIQLGGDGGVS